MVSPAPPLEAMALCKKYVKARQGKEDSSKEFDLLNQSAREEDTSAWQAQAESAAAERVRNPAAMDIYDVKMAKGEALCSPPSQF
jgi:hypothetical protein